MADMDNDQILEVTNIVRVILDQHEISLTDRAQWEMVTKAFILGMKYERDGSEPVYDILKSN